MNFMCPASSEAGHIADFSRLHPLLNYNKYFPIRDSIGPKVRMTQQGGLEQN